MNTVKVHLKNGAVMEMEADHSSSSSGLLRIFKTIELSDVLVMGVPLEDVLYYGDGKLADGIKTIQMATNKTKEEHDDQILVMCQNQLRFQNMNTKMRAALEAVRVDQNIKTTPDPEDFQRNSKVLSNETCKMVLEALDLT